MMTDSAAPSTSILTNYQAWLSKQTLAENARRTYLTKVRQYWAYIEQAPPEYGDPLHDSKARDYAVRDYKAHLKDVRKRKPNTVNIALAAIDHFYSFLNMPPAQV